MTLESASQRPTARRGTTPRAARSAALLVATAVAVVFTALAAIGPATASSDTALDDTVPPVLSALSVDPATVDVSSASSSAPATVTVTAAITDDLSGFAGGDMWIESPSGTRLWAPFWPPSDPPTATFFFNRYAESGAWHVYSVYLRDRAGNGRSLSRSDLQALGLDVTVTVTGGTTDTAAPVLSALSVDPATVDVSSASSSAPATVTVTAAITDDLSGFAGGDMSIESPSGARLWAPFWPPSDPPTATLRFNRYAENGAWHVYSVYLRDRAGNGRSLSRSDLQALGLDVTVTVTGGTADTDAPVLASLSVEPATVVTSAGAATVTVTAAITDDVSGFQWATIWFRSPSGSQFVTSGDPGNGFRSLGGDRYEAAVTFGEYAETGAWHVYMVGLRDEAGNSRWLFRSDLQALGFDPTVTVRPPDVTPPVLTVAGVAVDATSPQGAVVSYDVTATDDSDPHPVVTCSAASGSLFSIGDTTVVCTATDETGNTATASFTVHVKGAIEQVDDLIALLDSYEIGGKHGASLHQKLASAKNVLLLGKRWKAGWKLDSFLQEVGNQTGKALTVEQAAELTLRAERIKDVLDV